MNNGIILVQNFDVFGLLTAFVSFSISKKLWNIYDYLKFTLL